MTRGLETGHRANVNGASGRYNTRRTERAISPGPWSGPEYRCPIAQMGEGGEVLLDGSLCSDVQLRLGRRYAGSSRSTRHSVYATFWKRVC